VKSYILSSCLASLLAASVVLAQPDPQIQSLHQEIAALELDHALNLTPAQARTLLPLLRERAAAQKQHAAQRETQKGALVAALTKKRDELRATGTVSPQTAEALRQFHAGMAPQEGKAFREQLHATLTPEQREAVKNLKGPGGRGDQEGEHGGKGRGMFMRHRAMTSDAFVALVEARAQR